MATPRLLLLTHRFPYPPDRGDRIRSWQLLRLLARHFTVDLACTDRKTPTSEQLDAVKPLVDRHLSQVLSLTACAARSASALVARDAITPRFFYERALARQIVAWHEQSPYDVVLTFCTAMMRYSGELLRRSPQLAHVLDLVDVDSEKWRQLAAESRWPRRILYTLEARRLLAYERGEIVPTHAVTVVNAREAELYRQRVGDRQGLYVAGNGVDLQHFRPLPAAHTPTIVFTGILNYPPNVQGVCWFARKVLPLVRHNVPQAEFAIVGRHAGSAVRRLGLLAGVRFIGEVADVRSSLQEAAVVVAPLRLARGVQNKVLEAMASGRAVVCSPAAAQGIEAQAGQDFLVADTPEQWAAELTLLLTQPQRRSALGQAARALVEQRYSWDHQLAPMLQAIRYAQETSAGGKVENGAAVGQAT